MENDAFAFLVWNLASWTWCFLIWWTVWTLWIFTQLWNILNRPRTQKLIDNYCRSCSISLGNDISTFCFWITLRVHWIELHYQTSRWSARYSVLVIFCSIPKRKTYLHWSFVPQISTEWPGYPQKHTVTLQEIHKNSSILRLNLSKFLLHTLCWLAWWITFHKKNPFCDLRCSFEPLSAISVLRIWVIMISLQVCLAVVTSENFTNQEIVVDTSLRILMNKVTRHQSHSLFRFPQWHLHGLTCVFGSDLLLQWPS